VIFSLVAAFVGSMSVLAPPEVSAKSAVLMDAENGRVLWCKDPDTPRYPASTTKIMTALLLIERAKLDDVIVGPPGIDQVGESSMHMKVGEKVPARDMLYAMMLRSANDGCVAVATHVAGSVPAFVSLMNKRAKECGAAHTTFNNPNGLNDPLHKTTARDLALMGREAMRNPIFREVVRTPKYQIRRTVNVKDKWMKTRNKWLKKDPTADGIKTGYTVPAGHCYVGSATRQGFRLITVVLDSDHWQQDHQNLLKWGYDRFVKSTKLEPNRSIGERKVGDKIIEVALDAPLYVLRRKHSSDPTPVFEPAPSLPRDIKPGDTVGKIVLRDDSGFRAEQKAIALRIENVTSPAAQGKKSSPLPQAAFATVLLGGLMFYRSRTRKTIKKKAAYRGPSRPR